MSLSTTMIKHILIILLMKLSTRSTSHTYSVSAFGIYSYGYKHFACISNFMILPNANCYYTVSPTIPLTYCPYNRGNSNEYVNYPALTSRCGKTRVYSSCENGEDNDVEDGKPFQTSINDDSIEGSTGKKILSLAIPALVGLAIDPLMTLVDTAFVGRYSTDSASLSGMGSAAALLTFSFYIFNFLCTATTPLVSLARAKGDESRAVAVGGQALSLAALIGVVLCSLLQGFHQPLLDIMGTEYTGEEANSFANIFLQIRALAAPAVFLCSAATGILRGYLDTKTAIVILLGANAINLSLDVVLIVGMGLGPMGAAIATTSAEWLSAISFLLVLAGKLPSAEGSYLGSNQKVQTAEDQGANRTDSRGVLAIAPTFSIPRWSEVESLIVASSSVFLRSIILQLFLSGAASMAARGFDGSASVAAHQIAIQLWLLCSFACDALAAASQTLVADAMGRNDQYCIRNVTWTVLSYSIILGLGLSLLLGIGTYSDTLVTLFTTDESIQSELAPILSLIILAQPLNALVFAADGILQGASEFAYQAKTMWISVAAAVLSFIALQLSNGDLYSNHDTLIHVWQSMLILQAMRGITSYLKVVDTNGPINLLK